MAAKFKISINNPCAEKWDKMFADGHGRFCNSCQQSVTDFTRFSDDDLKVWFIENRGKTCGKFNAEQLNRLISIKSKYSISNFKPSLVAASFIAFLSFPKFSSAQTQKPATVQTDNFQRIKDKVNAVVPDSNIIIKGMVLDKDDKLPLTGVSLKFGNALKYATTNDKGEFEIKLPKDMAEDKFDITVTYIGYKTLTTQVDMLKAKEINLELCVSEELLGGPELYYVRNPSIWDRLRQVFGKKPNN